MIKGRVLEGWNDTQKVEIKSLSECNIILQKDELRRENYDLGQW